MGEEDTPPGSEQEATGTGGGTTGAGGGTTGATSGAGGATNGAGGGATNGAGSTTSGAGGGDPSGTGAGGGDVTETTGFSVRGRFLYDRCGEKVLLRGVNEMVVWLSNGNDGLPEYQEIAKTGANTVRIVWNIKDSGANVGESASNLDRTITNALAQKLIPIVELHDATGKWELLPSLVDYWTKPEVVAVIKKHEQNLLVNIGNEVGDVVANADWEAGYKDAITRMRGAGITVPLIIDASKWGQNIDQLQAVGPALVAHDPNILLSVHMWWTDGSAAAITRELQESVALNLPLMVGEFAQHAVYECSQHPFEYEALLAKSVELEVGWLAWSWGAVKNGDCQSDGPFDMTTNGTFAGLTGWGLEVAVTDPNSIQNTSVRPHSIETGSCR